jgi:phosphoglucosamine mutase
MSFTSWAPKSARIGTEPNGLNINQDVGATAPAALREAVIAQGADIGIALDGDGDRLIMVDAIGNMYDGDQLLFAVVRSRLRQGPVAGVVGHLDEQSRSGARWPNSRFLSRAAVGDRYVMDMLRQKGWLFGGENSGHILCLDRHTTGDGIVSALQVLSALREEGGDLQQLLGSLKLYPQRLINVGAEQGLPMEAATR